MNYGGNMNEINLIIRELRRRKKEIEQRIKEKEHYCQMALDLGRPIKEIEAYDTEIRELKKVLKGINKKINEHIAIIEKLESPVQGKEIPKKPFKEVTKGREIPEYEIPADFSEEKKLDEKIVKNWYEFLKRRVEELVKDECRGKVTDIKVKHMPGGITTSVTAEVEVKMEKKFFAKSNLLLAAKEIKGYKILYKTSIKKHLPPISSEKGGLILMPFISSTNFHYIVAESVSNKSPLNTAKDIYKDFIEGMERLWWETRDYLHLPDNQKEYIKRIEERAKKIREKYPDIFDKRILVNGEEYPSLDSLIDIVKKKLNGNNAKFSCIAHRDEHPGNILVDTDNPKMWMLIDYPNARKGCDWVYSIAKMSEGWSVFYFLDECLRKNESPKPIFKKNSNIKIDYTISIPKEIKYFKDMVMNLARKVAKRSNDNKWKERYYIAKFTVIFGSIYYHIEKHPFAVPILIGESIKALKPLLKNRRHRKATIARK